jgi:hypothetical protein
MLNKRLDDAVPEAQLDVAVTLLGGYIDGAANLQATDRPRRGACRLGELGHGEAGQHSGGGDLAPVVYGEGTGIKQPAMKTPPLICVKSSAT